jgi:hypothetical protein
MNKYIENLEIQLAAAKAERDEEGKNNYDCGFMDGRAIGFDEGREDRKDEEKLAQEIKVFDTAKCSLLDAGFQVHKQPKDLWHATGSDPRDIKVIALSERSCWETLIKLAREEGLSDLGASSV